MKKEIIVNIEIPMNSNIKFEYNREKNIIAVDRILRNGFKYPANYGYIPQTLDWDGDELDVLIYSNEVFPPGVSLNARIIGAMKMIDDGETDTKLIVVHSNDYKLDKIINLEDLPKKWLENVETFFSTYKNWKKIGITLINGFENYDYAINEYKECIQLWKLYGKMNKNDFITKMKLKHPSKYTKQ